MPSPDELLEILQRDGVAAIPRFIAGDRLQRMQRAMESVLERLRLNNIDGYEKTEQLRDMVEHPLLLEQGFVDIGLDPNVLEVARRYVGPKFQLVEAKGWRSRVTKGRGHGWHGDSWYDQTAIRERIPPEIKLGLYLTDVTSGGFAYVKGTHRKYTPRLISAKDVDPGWAPASELFNGAAGTAILFDTSGIHRQSMPILQERIALFYCYHDASMPLQSEDVEYNRYHPLLLNAAFLGGLTTEQQRVLGFGDQRQFFAGYKRQVANPLMHNIFNSVLDAKLWMAYTFEPLIRRFKRLRR